LTAERFLESAFQISLQARIVAMVAAAKTSPYIYVLNFWLYNLGHYKASAGYVTVIS